MKEMVRREKRDGERIREDKETGMAKLPTEKYGQRQIKHRKMKAQNRENKKKPRSNNKLYTHIASKTME